MEMSCQKGDASSDAEMDEVLDRKLKALINGLVQNEGNLYKQEASMDSLLKLANSAELRDVDFEREYVTEFLRYLLDICLLDLEQQQASNISEKLVLKIFQFLNIVKGFPEFNRQVVLNVLNYQHCLNGINRTALENAVECDLVTFILRACYQHHIKMRVQLRTLFGSILDSASKLNENLYYYKTPLRIVLKLLGEIIQGFQVPLSKINKKLLTQLILPLHAIPGKVSHQTPLLATIHQELTFCLLNFLKLDPQLISPIILSINQVWPTSWCGNTPKEVLLIHEIETIIQHAPPVDVESKSSDKTKLADTKYSAVVKRTIINRIVTGLQSDHSAVCERTLKIWQNDKVARVLCTNYFAEELLESILRPLLTSSARHWNSTVVKMTGLVLHKYISLTDEFIHRKLIKLARDILMCDPNDSDQAVSQRLLQVASDLYPIESLSLNESKTQLDDVHSIKASIPEKQHSSALNMIQGHVLGEGSFGVVYYSLLVVKGKPRSEWLEYALKQIPNEHSLVAYREAKMMELVCHPNCTRLIAMYESSRFVNLVFEYAANGDLHTIITQLGSMDVSSCRFISGEVAAALNAIHSAGMIYGDLKCENVLIHANGHAKLGDFGSAREEKDCGHGAPLEGTLCYVPPEVIKNEKLSYSLDWWAFGCFIYQMLSGRPPIWIDDDADKRVEVERIVTFQIDESKFPDSFPPQVMGVVCELLVHDPVERLGGKGGAKQVERHQFYADYNVAFEELHLQKAPTLAAGKVKPKPGPWTQRTYSMMHSPLPTSYVFDTDSVKHTIDEVATDAGAAWSAKQFFDGLDVSPAKLIKLKQNHKRLQQAGGSTATSATSTSLSSSGGKREPKQAAMRANSVMSAPGRRFKVESKMPTAATANNRQRYMVKGLDLSAG